MGALTVGSLFSGIGGFDLGLERAGMSVKWQVENNGWCQRVLEKHWPTVTRYGDITGIGWNGVEPVDLVCGGFPCQPFSAAGKRKGHTDDRYLWPEVTRCIAATRPTWCLFENVLGLASLYQYHDTSTMEGKDYSSQTEAEARFEGICEREGQNALALVLDDLERLGYAVKAFVISASAFDAPHLRKRIWIVAHAESEQSPSRDYRTEPRIFSQPEQVEFRGSDSEGMRSSHWAVEPDVGRVAHGIPRRVDRLRGLGNAVVPQIVEWIGKMIMEVRNENTIL